MDHSHGSDGHAGEKHFHDVIDPRVADTERGIRAVKWSFWALLATALLQTVVVAVSGSVALLADTLHNFGDAFTALPLWIAFHLSRRPATKRLTYGWGRLEDLAGIFIVMVILASALAAGYKSFMRFVEPRQVELVWVVAAAAVTGFAGNELVARFRIKVGRQINSAALEADGHHARVDGIVSLGVLIGVLGIWLGYPLADPIVGLLITLTILKIVWDAGKRVALRLIDAVDPDVVDDIRRAAADVSEVREVSDIRVRWIGHRLHAEVNLAVAGELQSWKPTKSARTCSGKFWTRSPTCRMS